ncbi:MAG: SGNH/GDSL hydrolase family protein [Acutalibacteraceae bacterium]
MKRWMAVLLAAAVCLGVMSGCKAPDSWEKVSNEVVNVVPTDAFGDHSISILGDSISHGATSVDIVNNSWVGLLKKAVNAASEDNNYGFTTVEGTLWGAVQSHELHPFPTCNYGQFKERGQNGKGWTEYRTAELLGTKGLGSVKKGDWLQFAPTEQYAYFCVYYQSGPKYGSFTVGGSDGAAIADLNGATEVSCQADEETFARTAFYDATLLKEDGAIRITTTSDKEVIITGIGYYNTLGGVVVNNYSNGGLQFAGTGKSQNGNMTGLDNSIVDFAATSGTLIFALGYNDAHFFDDYDLFTEKINHLIEVANANGTKVIVNDLCWDFDTGNGKYHDRYQFLSYIKDDLKRLAEETNGVYVSPQDIYGQELLDTISDGAHPNAEGHKMIADAVIAALGLPEAEA